MDHYQKMHAENKHMALIREDSLENRSQDQRWEDMVRKSKRSQADKSMNYENIQLGNMGNGNHSSKGFLTVSNLKRTSSEQIRPMKDRFNERSSARKQEDENRAVKSSEDPRNKFKSPNQSLMDLSSNDPSDSILITGQGQRLILFLKTAVISLPLYDMSRILTKRHLTTQIFPPHKYKMISIKIPT